jgi:hypothetical protein
MANFGLTQWILGASSAVFPGALPQIDASQAAILKALQEAQNSPWTRIALSAVSTIAPSLGKLIKSGGDLSATYQDLGKQGVLTSNVLSPTPCVPSGLVPLYFSICHFQFCYLSSFFLFHVPRIDH